MLIEYSSIHLPTFASKWCVKRGGWGGIFSGAYVILGGNDIVV